MIWPLHRTKNERPKQHPRRKRPMKIRKYVIGGRHSTLRQWWPSHARTVTRALLASKGDSNSIHHMIPHHSILTVVSTVVVVVVATWYNIITNNHQYYLLLKYNKYYQPGIVFFFLVFVCLLLFLVANTSSDDIKQTPCWRSANWFGIQVILIFFCHRQSKVIIIIEL